MYTKKFFVLFLLGLFTLGDINAIPKQINAIKNEQPEKKDTLRIFCYNIHHCNPPSKKDFIDIDAIVKTIRNRNPDIVALQEVDVNIKRSGDVNQAKAIAKKLGMKYCFAKAIDYDGGEYGVAILTKYKLKNFTVHTLPMVVPVKEARVVATARIKLPSGESIMFGCTHLDVEEAANREAQVAEINKIAEQQSLPFIIAGDFNAVPESDAIKLLDKQFQRTCEHCAPTIPQIGPKRTIDFIAFSPKGKFRIISHEVINETYASDHRPIFSILEYNP